MAELVSSLMGKIDAKRRAQVFYHLSEQDNSLLEQLQEYGNPKSDGTEDDDDDGFAISTDFNDAWGNASQSCQQSYSTYSAQMLMDDNSVLGHAEYQWSMAVIDAAPGGLQQTRTALEELRNIVSIRDNIVSDANAEMDMLQDHLLIDVDKQFQEKVGAGVSAQYRASVANNSSLATKEQILDDQKAELADVGSQILYLVQSQNRRTTSEQALNYVYEWMDKLNTYRSAVKQDEFSEKANEVITTLILSLQDMADALISEDESLKSKMSQMENEKEELLTERQQALDDNDLAGAALLDAQISAMDADMEAEKQKILAEMGAEGASESDQSKALSALGENSMEANIIRARNDALADIAEGDMENLGDAVDMLSEYGASGALQSLLDALPSGADSKLKNSLKNALKDANENVLSSLNGNIGAGNKQGAGLGTGTSGSGTESGAGTGENGSEAGAGGTGTGGAGDAGDADALAKLGRMSEDELMALLEGLLGTSFDDMRADGQVVVAATLNRLGEQGVRSAASLANQLITRCGKKANPYVFAQLNDSSTKKYITFKSIGKATTFRYVYNDSKREVTMSDTRGQSYTFLVGEAKVKLTDGKKVSLDGNINFGNRMPYIGEKDTQTYFQCNAEYIQNSEYGACINQKMEQQITELIEQMKEGV